MGIQIKTSRFSTMTFYNVAYQIILFRCRIITKLTLKVKSLVYHFYVSTQITFITTMGEELCDGG